MTVIPSCWDRGRWRRDGGVRPGPVLIKPRNGPHHHHHITSPLLALFSPSRGQHSSTWPHHITARTTLGYYSEEMKCSHWRNNNLHTHWRFWVIEVRDVVVVCSLQNVKSAVQNISDRPSQAIYGRPYFLFQIYSFSSCKHPAAIISDSATNQYCLPYILQPVSDAHGLKCSLLLWVCMCWCCCGTMVSVSSPWLGIGCLMPDPVKCPNEVGASPTPHSGR